jgi:hypothetical protein
MGKYAFEEQNSVILSTYDNKGLGFEYSNQLTVLILRIRKK